MNHRRRGHDISADHLHPMGGELPADHAVFRLLEFFLLPLGEDDEILREARFGVTLQLVIEEWMGDSAIWHSRPAEPSSRSVAQAEERLPAPVVTKMINRRAKRPRIVT